MAVIEKNIDENVERGETITTFNCRGGFILKTVKDKQGCEISSEYKAPECRIIIEGKNNKNDHAKVCLDVCGKIFFDDKVFEPVKDGYTAPVTSKSGQKMIAEYSNNKLKGWVAFDADTSDDTPVGFRDIKYYPNGKKHHDSVYCNIRFSEFRRAVYKQDICYDENENVIGISMSLVSARQLGSNFLWEERYNSEGCLIYRALARNIYDGIVCMEEYDETGTRLIRSINPGDEEHVHAVRCADYDEKGNPILEIYKDGSSVGKILRVVDYNEKLYPNGQKKFEEHNDGSKTKWYDTGEVLSQTDKEGKETFYYKDGKERMTIEADGTKNVVYDGGQFLLISGRHCQKDDYYDSLTDEGRKQAENIGKLIAYASQGKIAKLAHIVLPEVYSSTSTERVIETNKIILETINDVLQRDTVYPEVDRRYPVEACKHEAKSELSINRMYHGFDTADDKMGSIAFSVVGRDGFVIDRVVFNAEQIAEQLEKVKKEEQLMQQTKDKIEKFKEETLEKCKNKFRFALLRKVLKDNVSDKKGEVKPKRSDADKNAIREAIKGSFGNEKGGK